MFSDDIIFYNCLVTELPLPRKIVLFRNKIPRSMYDNVRALNENGFELYTFDESDAKQLNMNFRGQFIPCIYDFGRNDNPHNKAYFLGLGKGRQNILMQLSEELKRKNIKPDITIVKKYNIGFKIYVGKKSYKENLREVHASKYIIDIVQEGQVGLTLRALESLFYKRKLITNNDNIKNYDFFNENNILILDDSLEIPDSFINADYELVNDAILQKYRSTHYYSNIIGSKAND